MLIEQTPFHSVKGCLESSISALTNGHRTPGLAAAQRSPFKNTTPSFMLKPHALMLATLCCASAVSCQTNSPKSTPLAAVTSANSPKSTPLAAVTSAQSRESELKGVKTTAYTHTESDHLKYKTAAAAGGELKYGEVRSAAADWAVYPVGTVFQIAGDKTRYEVDDYGSALVGTETIDLYKPSKAAMDQWGARRVNINVIKWGSFPKSMAILKPREGKAPHIHQMITEIKRKGTGST